MKITATFLRFALAGAALIAPSAARAQFERIVLLEEYTSVTCTPCATAGRNVNAILAANPVRVVSVRYHTNFIPSPKDRFYEANKTENEARRDYYGWVGMPVIRVDGTTEPPATNRSEVESRVASELAIESPIRIVVTQEPIEGAQMRVTVTVTAGPDGIAAGNQLRVVAVESNVHDPLFANSPYNGEVDVRDIMRKFITGTDGVAIEMQPNTERVFTYTYPVDPTWQAGQMYALAFVQEDFDKAVMQAGYSPRPVSSVESPTLAGYSARSVSANPTTGSVRIDYALGGAGDLAVTVLDVAGNVVRSSVHEKTGAGHGTLSLDLGNLPSGTYTVALSSGLWRWSDKVAVVR